MRKPTPTAALLPILAAWGYVGTAVAAPAPNTPSVGYEATAVRVIVMLRATVAGSDGGTADIAALAGRTGLALRQRRKIESRLRVVDVGVLAAPGSAGAALERLRADPSVQYAELDRRRHPHATWPDDPLFSGQWYLQNEQSDPTALSAIDAVTAWDTTMGSQGVVIAVLDTGVRYDHPDLLGATSGGRLLPGYDFITNTAEANDGDGRDPDASDPGDWVTASDIKTLPFSGCEVSDSSWHGTRVAGIIGARTDNAAGVAGIGWSGWILPVRVLGKCGGFDSDIIAGMLWAGGIAVSGVPANPYPARVINLSLGSADTCPASYTDVITQLRGQGVLVIASAGNEGTVVDAPANCPGVAAVAGIRQVGTKVGFSNLGPEVALSAPGGNCVNVGPGDACLYSIDTTTNLGTQGPAANGYTDRVNNINVGTSFSAPIVAGITGLMLAVNGRLDTTQMIARLEEGATKPFPTSGDPTVPVCHVPANSSDVQDSECVCTTSTCGAGMANARGAVAAALRPIAAIAVPASYSPGQNVVLRGSGSGAACGHTLSPSTPYAWTVVAGSASIVGASTDTATVVAPASGSFTLRLTVTDDAGRQDTADVLVGPTSAMTVAPSAAGAVPCAAPLVVISVSPASATVRTGGSQTFAASLVNGGGNGVTWYVNGVAGGSASTGTISVSGVYTAPANVPVPATVTIKVVPDADPTRFALATVTVIKSAPPSGGGGGGGGGAIDTPLLLLLAARAWIGARRATGRERHQPAA
jgi:serine protease